MSTTEQPTRPREWDQNPSDEDLGYDLAGLRGVDVTANGECLTMVLQCGLGPQEAKGRWIVADNDAFAALPDKE